MRISDWSSDVCSSDLLQSRRYRLPRLEHAPCQDRRRHLLGSMVPGMRPFHGAARRRDPVLPDRYRLGAAEPQAEQPGSLATGDEIGQASGWERVGKSVEKSVVAESLQKKKHTS